MDDVPCNGCGEPLDASSAVVMWRGEEMLLAHRDHVREADRRFAFELGLRLAEERRAQTERERQVSAFRRRSRVDLEGLFRGDHDAE